MDLMVARTLTQCSNPPPSSPMMPNLLLINDGTGAFTEDTTTAFTAVAKNSHALALADIDGE